MSDSQQIFQRFAGEVRSSAGFLNSKFKAIKMSTEEAQRCRSHIEATAAEDGEAVPSIPLRPETPGNIRGLYRSVKRDVLRLRETFSTLGTDNVNPGDLDQVDRLIQELERQLEIHTNNLEKLKNIRPKTSRPKSKRPKKSAKAVMPVDTTDDVPKENEKSGEVLKETFTGMKRHVSMPPVVSTKLKKPFPGRTSASTTEKKSKNLKESPPTQKKRAWGSFHGHRTLSRDKSDVVPLPPAPDTSSMVSSGSLDSVKSPPDQNNNVHKSHFNFTHAPSNLESPRITREKTHIKRSVKPAAKLNIQREGVFNVPGRRDYTRQEPLAPMRKVNREFTNLETVDLNIQVDPTFRAPPARRTYSTMVENQGTGEIRRPSYLVNRSRTIPETVIEKRVQIRKPKIGYPFGSSFPELPPLSSLKRGCYPSSNSQTK